MPRVPLFGLSLSGSRADHHVAAPGSGAPRPTLPWKQQLLSSLVAVASAVGGNGLLLFGLLSFLFLLAIPSAVRWLRPALALGMSPAYVAPGDRPG